MIFSFYSRPIPIVKSQIFRDSRPFFGNSPGLRASCASLDSASLGGGYGWYLRSESLEV